uniref:Diminazene-resistance-associated protein n=1 Tax=Trypanosoma evansi TaxID=5697 RepID=Q4H4B3_TRYEV|nr:Diminazene-resistance-associated protein [Trypanosoma evansi]
MRTHHRLRLTAALVILAHTVHQAKATGGAALSVETRQAVCGLAEDLATFPAYVATQMKNALQAEASVSADELKLQIYIQQHSQSDGPKYIPLQAALAEKAQSNLDKLMTHTEKAIDATAAVANLQGRLAETMEMMAGLHQNSDPGTGAGCPARDASNVYTGRDKLTNCGATTKSAAQKEPNPPSKINQQGFPQLSTTPGTTGTAAGTAQCHLTHTQANNGPTGTTRTADGATLAAGYIKLADNDAGWTLEDLRQLNTGHSSGKPKPFTDAHTNSQGTPAAFQQLPLATNH